jgi:hypothetical protein
MVNRLRIAGRYGPLHHALDECAAGGVAGKKSRDRIGVGPAAGRIGQLSAKELE